MAYAQLQLNREVTLQDMAAVLERSRQHISRTKKDNLTQEQIEKIENGLGISLKQKKEYFEIPYLEIENVQNQRMKNNLITTLWLDRELIENDWKKEAQNLRVIKMIGDKMDFGEYPLKHNHTLLVDISETDIINSGVYVFTTENEGKTFVFICGISVQTNGNVKFYFANSKTYAPKILTPKELKDCNFTVLARVVKNLSLTL
ncbi:MAG: hypothetical protein NC191_10095 [Muribaculaceae bacterium]|nr:hypothetical protein [Muribaculaceae bacterium]